jgi:hypothetical protein
VRNLAEYPITDQEIVSTLKDVAVRMAADDASNFTAGSMEALILMTAADIIASPTKCGHHLIIQALNANKEKLEARIRELECNRWKK